MSLRALTLPLLVSALWLGACSPSPSTISGMKCSLFFVEEACKVTAKALQALSAVSPDAGGVRLTTFGRFEAKVLDDGHRGALFIRILPEGQEPYNVLQASLSRHDDGVLNAVVTRWQGDEMPEIVAPLEKQIDAAARKAKRPDLDGHYLLAAKEYRQSVVKAAGGKP